MKYYLLIPLLVIIAVVFWVLVMVFGSLSTNLCGETVEKTVYSPDNKYKGVFYSRDCGATTDYSSQIKLVKNNLFGLSKIIFVADGYYGKLEMKWENNDCLAISCVDCQIKNKLPKQLSEWGGIKINYYLSD